MAEYVYVDKQEDKALIEKSKRNRNRKIR